MPTEKANRAVIPSSGFRPPVTSRATSGRTTNKASPTPRNRKWTAACNLGGNRRIARSAYRYPNNSATWKKSMQVVHTAAVPPNTGSIHFAVIGWI